MNILIPMAGLGSRFIKEGFLTPKPLIKTNGKTLIEHSIESLKIEGRYIFITRKYENIKHNEELTELLKKIKPNCIEICLKEQTNGPVETCLAAKKYVDDETELIITNCDQRTDWDVKSFIDESRKSLVDGSVVTHKSDNPKHSYAKVDIDGKITKIKEKEVISNFALVGVHYWKHGRDFISSSEKLLIDNGKENNYISETYNFLIKDNKNISIYQILDNSHIFLGTPYDVSIYESKVYEYETPKPKTIFCDLDGTILYHHNKYSELLKIDQALLDGVKNKFNEWDSIGHKIILVTARKESARQFTEKKLEELGIPYDYLLMGITSGERFLINDKMTNKSADRAASVNVITNKGFKDIDWKKIGL